MFDVGLTNPELAKRIELILDGDSVGTLLLTAFGCEDWIVKIRQPLSERGTKLIDPYPFSGTV